MKSLLALMLLLNLSNFASASDNKSQLGAQSPDPASNQSISKIESEPSGNTLLIRLEPHWLLLRELTADFQFIVSDKFTVGPILGYMSGGDGIYYGTKVSKRFFYDDKTNRTSIGLRSVFYFQGTEKSSAYLSAFGKYRKNEVTFEAGSSSILGGPGGKAEFNETVVGLTGGYQWVWMKLLTLNVGGGIANYEHPESIELQKNDGSRFTLELGKEKVSYALDVGLGVQF